MFKIETNRRKIIFTIFFIKFSLDFKVFIPMIKILDCLIPKKKNMVCFCLIPSMLSSCKVFLNYLKKHSEDKYNTVAIAYKNSDNFDFENLFFVPSLLGLYKALRSKYIIISSADVSTMGFFASKRHIYLNFWHGMPVKTLGYARKNMSNSYYKLYKFIGDNAYFFVASDLFKQLMISCFRADFNKVFVTGQARTDLIAENKNDEKIKQIFNLKQYKKFVFYMPTWMSLNKPGKRQIEQEFKNIFYLDDYNESSFVDFIEKNNILFIMKPHPREEYLYKTNSSILPDSKNFRILFGNELSSLDIQTYELFKFVDCMVSDYSSAPIDFLILNRPVVYLNSLAEGYSKNRGMILEDNYEILMPGVKVKTYSNFEKALIDALTVDSFKQKREELLPLIHKYRDFNSCDRIYNIMKELK